MADKASIQLSKTTSHLQRGTAATFPNMSRVALLFLFLALSTKSSSASALPASTITDSEVYDPIHERLPDYGLPRGLVPNYVKSYTFSEDTGDFVVELEDAPCYAHQAYLVYYEKKVTGRLSYGKITELTGVQAKKLFFWVSITGMVADPKTDEIVFQSGIFSERLPAKQFEEIATCSKDAVSGLAGAVLPSLPWRGLGSM